MLVHCITLFKKQAIFRLEQKQLDAFELLKGKLIEALILTIYNPNDLTELHCDASSQGFGAVLLQHKADKRFHPVFYFSKRATEVESHYHSYELDFGYNICAQKIPYLFTGHSVQNSYRL